MRKNQENSFSEAWLVQRVQIGWYQEFMEFLLQLRTSSQILQISPKRRQTVCITCHPRKDEMWQSQPVRQRAAQRPVCPVRWSSNELLNFWSGSRWLSVASELLLEAGGSEQRDCLLDLPRRTFFIFIIGIFRSQAIIGILLSIGKFSDFSKCPPPVRGGGGQ